MAGARGIEPPTNGFGGLKRRLLPKKQRTVVFSFKRELAMPNPRGFLIYLLLEVFYLTSFKYKFLAGARGIEPPTNGFGDRYSTS
jgi:hypothetical protein